MSKEGFIFLNMIIWKFGDISIFMVKLEPMENVTLIPTESHCSFNDNINPYFVGLWCTSLHRNYYSYSLFLCIVLALIIEVSQHESNLT